MHFDFATAGRIIFGEGALRQAGPLAREWGVQAMIVTGSRPDRASELASLLEAEGVESFAFPISGEPDIETVESGLTMARERGCTWVASMGGGSALDTGKAIAVMLTNPGELMDYLEVIGRGKTLTEAPAPFMAIPTTAGTGSEVTRNAVLASPPHRVKVSLRSPLMLARVAIVDPELTYDLPPAVSASTGLDALTQLIEPYVCSRANPLVDAFCAEALPRVARSLREVVHDHPRPVARADMALAGLFGGLALANAGLGAVHGLAGPIGGMFPAPHGAVCAALLPSVMAANIAALRRFDPESESLRRYDEVGRLLTGHRGADEAVQWVALLVSDLQIPRLHTYGLTRDDIPELVDKAQLSSSMKANPVSLTGEELAEALAEAL